MSNQKNKDTVTVTIPLTRENSGDVYLCINGKAIQIQRGVAVSIPKAYANLLARSMREQRKAYEFEEEMKQ